VILLDGTLADGTRVVVEGDHPYNARVTIGGEPVEVIERLLFRDGGSWQLNTTRGRIVDTRKRLPRRDPDDPSRMPTFDGQPITVRT
jgi:hypothetical protein